MFVPNLVTTKTNFFYYLMKMQSYLSDLLSIGGVLHRRIIPSGQGSSQHINNEGRPNDFKGAPCKVALIPDHS